MHGVLLMVLGNKTSKDSAMKCVRVASDLSEPIGKMREFMKKIQEGAANGQIKQKRSKQERDAEVSFALLIFFFSN